MNTALIERQLAEHARRLEAIEEAITALCSLRPTVESIRRNVTQLNTWRAEIDAEDAKLLNEYIVAGRVYNLEITDMNGDGLEDCGDVLAILQIAEQNP